MSTQWTAASADDVREHVISAVDEPVKKKSSAERVRRHRERIRAARQAAQELQGATDTEGETERNTRNVSGPMPTLAQAERLTTIADSLDLTEIERRFAEALALDPTRNQSKAIVTAGYKGVAPGQAAYQMFKKPHVKSYFNAIVSEGQKARARGTVATLQEVLESITDDMRFQGKDWKRREKAQDKMARVHGAYKDSDAAQNRTPNVTLVQVLQGNPQLARSVGMALLGAKKTTNAADGEVVDIETKVIE